MEEPLDFVKPIQEELFDTLRKSQQILSKHAEKKEPDAEETPDTIEFL